MTTVTVSAKGWIVIPKEIRERHGIRKGDKVHVLDFGGRISIIPATKGDPIERARGMFKGGPSSTAALVRDHREEVEREERKYQEWVKRRERRVE
jgi:AbrB family looped-hinge helix DNA binding protein